LLIPLACPCLLVVLEEFSLEVVFLSLYLLEQVKVLHQIHHHLLYLVESVLPHLLHLLLPHLPLLLVMVPVA
jgi:hypothetical protein